MHDRSMMDSLLRKIVAICVAHDASRVASIRVRLGAVSHLNEEHFREHWVDATSGTPLEAATVEVELSPEPFGVLLVDVELEA